jgi:hypothetical protein
MRKATDLIARANTVFRYEGIRPLVKSILALLSGLLFRYGIYYLFEYDIENIDNLDEADFMPGINGFTFRGVSTEEHIHELEAAGVDLRMWPSDTAERIKRGAIAFCVLVGRETAHITWVATNERAMAYMHFAPFKVDFSNGECCSSVWTNPKYRRQGFARYKVFREMKYLRDMGITKGRYTTLKSNTASLKAFAVFRMRICAEARYVKLLWWESWKEKPVDAGHGD